MYKCTPQDRQVNMETDDVQVNTSLVQEPPTAPKAMACNMPAAHEASIGLMIGREGIFRRPKCGREGTCGVCR